MSKQRLYRIEDVNAVREISQLAASRDGKLAAMSVSEMNPDGMKILSRVWLVDADSREGARAITVEGKRTALPRFSPDGRKLAYLSEQEEGKLQLAALTMPFSEPAFLTRFEQGVRWFDWLSSGRLLVLAPADRPARKKKSIEQKDDSYEVDTDEPCARMWVVAVAGGHPKPIGPAAGHVAVASTSPDGTTVAFVHAKHSTLGTLWRGSELHLLDVRCGRSRLIRRLTCPHAASEPPSFSPDGTKLAFVDSLRAGMIYPARVFVLDLRTGRITKLDPTSGEMQGQPRWLDDRTVVYLEQRRTSRKLCGADAAGRVRRDLIAWPGSTTDFAIAGTSGRVLFVYGESAKPPEVYSFERSSRQVRSLTTLNAKLAAVRHSPAEIVRWTSREGWTVEGIFHRPTKKVRAPFATVVVPHGGPHGAVSDAYERPLAQVLAARGYASFFPNFRGSTGYGEKFLLSIRRDWGKGPADDIVRGIEMLRRRRLADKRRIVVQGGSYGGYMTAWLIGHYDLFRAAVASAPVVNNISMWGTTDIPPFQEWSLGTNPVKDDDFYWRLSPVKWLKHCRVPTLVIVGDKDERVPPNQAQELYRTVQAAGARTKLIRYPREPHGIGEPKHKLDVLRRTLAWFRLHLGKDSPDR